MASAADSIRDFLAPLLPAPAWRMQFGRWTDGTGRFVVLKPAGGVPAELVRRPQFTLTLIGQKVAGEAQGAAELAAVSAAANEVVEAIRTGSGALIHLEAGEPVFFATNDGRPVFELALSAITD